MADLQKNASCGFPARGLLQYRFACIRALAALKPSSETDRAKLFKRNLRAIDELVDSHSAIQSCTCFDVARRKRIAEAARRHADRTL